MDIHVASAPSETVTRAHLVFEVSQAVSLSGSDVRTILNALVNDIVAALVTGETVKLHGFGNFVVRSKGARIGRNPRTGMEAEITPRRVVRFKHSTMIEALMNNTAMTLNRKA